MGIAEAGEVFEGDTLHELAAISLGELFADEPATVGSKEKCIKSRPDPMT